MIEENEAWRTATRLSGAQHDFQRLTDPYRHELQVHCYRMLGSLEDAEDAFQEALLRAWRRLDTLKGEASLRAWLYRIATNVCLDQLKRRKARSLPSVLFAPADPHDELPAAIGDPIWLGPLPESYLAAPEPGPEARYETLESVSLAFLAALQRLPGRQRAALILHDVLGWRSQEVAELLGLSQAAINSALQRARATMKRLRVDQSFPALTPAVDADTAALLDRYVQAWETADLTTLVSLLRADALLTMPPLPAWYSGRLAIHEFYVTHQFAGQAQGRFRLLVTRANGCPALAMYQKHEDGLYRPTALQVISVEGTQIRRIDTWLVSDQWLFSRFRLPEVLSDR